MRQTAILGGYQSDFARNFDREGSEIGALAREVVMGTLENAGIGPDAVESIHVGNAFAELYTGQGHLGAMPATVVPELWGIPAMRHEAACASGSLAVLTAMAEIEAGRYDCVLALGIEQEKTMPGPQAAEVQSAAALVGREEKSASIWPCMFDQVAEEYDKRYGIDERHLRAIGELNLGNAKANPKAQTRSWKLTERSFAADDEMNPVIAGRLRRNDCCQITDGGAGVVLVSERWLAEHGGRAQARIIGWGHRTVGLALADKLERSRGETYVMPHVRGAIEDAFQRAGIAGVEDLDCIETHDCMTPSEYMAIDHFGITAPGESWKAIENGDLERGGRIPMNPSGGLIGVGHPVGATGIRMLVDVARQVSAMAGATQVENARRAATLNIGGSTATTVSFVVERS
ncbi:MAG: acetyl-CoA acetyltransferase [Deltaproteobacteria bacterium]